MDVSSRDAFQRVVVDGPEVLGSEAKTACRLLTRALSLREKHSYKKAPYYMGACKHEDYVAFMPASAPLPARDSIGSPLGCREAANMASAEHAQQDAAEAAGGSPGRGGGGGAGLGVSTAAGYSRAAQGGFSHGSSGTSSHTSAGSPPTSPGARPVLVGDALVSERTGKTYPPGMFYRRRPEPPFEPFKVEVPEEWKHMRARMVAGVYRVYPVEAKSSAGATGPEGPESGQGGGRPVRAVSLGLDLDGLAIAELPAHIQVGPHHSRGEGSAASGADTEREDAFDGGGEEEPGAHGPAGPGLFPVHTWQEWAADYLELVGIVNSPPVRSFAYRRLQLLSMRFDIHRMMNRDREAAEQKAVPHRDFFNCRRVDTHVHHSACMNQKHLLRFIKSKLKKESDTVVLQRDGKTLTLAGVFQSLNLTAYDLSLDVLDMHADWSVAHRFDRFNTKYNPLGQSRLREVFLKTDNLIRGRFLAEITKEVMEDLEATKYSMAEYRLSIYGRARDEWRKLAAWVVGNKLGSSQVRWMIQIPRLYDSMRAAGQITTFGDMLANVFQPLFEVTLNPSVDPCLHQFLSLVGGFDSVDDESKVEGHTGSFKDLPPPNTWAYNEQPPYAYQTYYMAANLSVLNQLRRSRGFTEFSFRPHSGEAGSPDHLAATFLTAESIAHGINLRRAPVLEYLYYLAQIGIAVSPLSNNRLFLELSKSPFPSFFERGHNVSLSTDDPLMLHLTREPLMEEYAVAMQVWHLSSADICEIARNSCLQSCFEHPFLSHWLGPDYRLPGPDGNAIERTNVPHIRLQYRLETLKGEFDLLHEGSKHTGGPLSSPVGGMTGASSAALFQAARYTAPQIVPHSPGSGRPLYRVVRRSGTDGKATPAVDAQPANAPAVSGGVSVYVQGPPASAAVVDKGHMAQLSLGPAASDK